MSAKFLSVGIVRLRPSITNRLTCPCDDSTLDLLLASLAHRHSLAETSVLRMKPARLVATRRLNWPPFREGDVSLRANTAQLIDDLQAEFDRAESVSV